MPFFSLLPSVLRLLYNLPLSLLDQSAISQAVSEVKDRLAWLGLPNVGLSDSRSTLAR
jgi:hypothetical protein